MKTLVLYYSYTGHTKKIAENLAVNENAEIVELKSVERPGKLKVYTLGCFAAIKGKSWPIQPLTIDLAAYDRLILLIPVWASNPPPYVNALWAQLPEGKNIAVKMISASGESHCRKRIEAHLAARGCVLDGYEDIKQ